MQVLDAAQVHVRVDEAGQQRRAGAVDPLPARRGAAGRRTGRRTGRGDRGDRRALHADVVAPVEQALAVEDAHVDDGGHGCS